MITFELFCSDEREFTPHAVERNGNIQILRCLSCQKERADIMIRKTGTNMNLNKRIWDMLEKEPLDKDSDEEDEDYAKKQ